MSTRVCLGLAVIVALVGIGLRLLIPVRPVDQELRDTLAFIAAMGPSR